MASSMQGLGASSPGDRNAAQRMDSTQGNSRTGGIRYRIPWGPGYSSLRVLTSNVPRLHGVANGILNIARRGVWSPQGLARGAVAHRSSGHTVCFCYLLSETRGRSAVGVGMLGCRCIHGAACSRAPKGLWPGSRISTGHVDHFAVTLECSTGRSCGSRRSISPLSTIGSSCLLNHLWCSAISSWQAPLISLNPVSIVDSRW